MKCNLQKIYNNRNKKYFSAEINFLLFSSLNFLNGFFKSHFFIFCYVFLFFVQKLPFFAKNFSLNISLSKSECFDLTQKKHQRPVILLNGKLKCEWKVSLLKHFQVHSQRRPRFSGEAGTTKLWLKGQNSKRV